LPHSISQKDSGYYIEQKILTVNESIVKSRPSGIICRRMELEVLNLIAEGRNNEEIAEKLFLSIRTVEKHLTNIYQKLGISGKSARAFAASYSIKNNLSAVEK